MKRRVGLYILIWLHVGLLFSCRELYEPEIAVVDHGFLVVEGFVEVGGGRSSVKLSRTVPVYADQNLRPVAQALLILEGQEAGSWQFVEKEAGEYVLDADLLESQNYKLRIFIGENESFESDWMQPLIAPEITDLYFEREEEGVFIYAEGQRNGEKGFMLLTAEETWQFRSAYNSLFVYNPETFEIEFRRGNIHVCFRQQPSDRIVLAAPGMGDFNKLEMMRIPLHSEKLGMRYSIEVKQRQVDEAAYEFWEALRRNTDDIGDIFSPMPHEFGSNLRKVGQADEPVIGYISAGKSTTKRVFIGFSEIRPWSVRNPDYGSCNREVLSPRHYPSLTSGDYLVIGPVEGDGGEWYVSTKYCVDCRERGTLDAPAFW